MSVLSHVLLVRERLEISELVCENMKMVQKCQNKWNTRERELKSGEAHNHATTLAAKNLW